MPPDDARRHLVAEGEHQHRRVIGERADLLGDVAADALDQGAVVEEGHVLRPRQADDHAEPFRGRIVEHRARGRRVDPDRIGTRARHRGEVAADLSRRRKLPAAVVRRERSVGDALDPESPVSCLQELTVHEDSLHV